VKQLGRELRRIEIAFIGRDPTKKIVKASPTLANDDAVDPSSTVCAKVSEPDTYLRPVQEQRSPVQIRR
jgi:hypothetical protein